MKVTSYTYNSAADRTAFDGQIIQETPRKINALFTLDIVSVLLYNHPQELTVSVEIRVMDKKRKKADYE